MNPNKKKPAKKTSDHTTKPWHETIADIAYLAGVHGYYSGDSRGDMQTFIHLAKKFEKEHAYVDWDANDLDYMTEIEFFAKKELKLVNKLNFVPDAAKEPWDNIEINRVKVTLEEVEEGKLIETDITALDEDDKEKEDFWSVYLHQREGGVQCIADLPSQELAEALAKLLENAVKSVHNNLKLVKDLDRPVRQLIIQVILTLMIHRDTYKRSQVGYSNAQKLIDELQKLIDNENSKNKMG
jgi:hypothetical protein